MYCWHSVEGYSKFGSYQGDDSVALDGAFIYTGFKPAFLIFKRANTGSAGFWGILDAARSINNPVGGTNTDSPLHANENFSEVQTAGAYHTDFLSNGFKFRSTQGAGSINTTGGTYIYMAFAESPFKYSAGR